MHETIEEEYLMLENNYNYITDFNDTLTLYRMQTELLGDSEDEFG